MPRKILIMGLSGSGKTSLSRKLIEVLKDAAWINADKVRDWAEDWDFSTEGRIRQAYRMARLAAESNSKFTIIDFIAPLKEQRNIVDADVIIWMDTIQSSRYPDTDSVFTAPDKYDFRFKTFNEINIDEIARVI